MSHVAVVGLSMVDLVSVVVVAMMCVGLVALRTGPVPLTQGWRHSLLAWDIVRLHEGHARQHRLAAQQPSLVMQTKHQSKIGINHINHHLTELHQAFLECGLYLRVIKAQWANAFTKINPFRLFWSQLRPKEPKWSSLPWLRTQAVVGWRRGCEKGTEKLAPGCFWRWKVIRTDPFHMVSNRVVGMVCHRRCLNACVFGENRGDTSLRIRGNRWDHTHPNHRGPRPESRGMTKRKANIFRSWNE